MTASKRSRFPEIKKEVLRLNILGYSGASIAKRFGMHPTSISHALTRMGVKPTDTRRAFMEEVFDELPENQVDWVANELGSAGCIKQFIKGLIADAHRAEKTNRKTQNQ